MTKSPTDTLKRAILIVQDLTNEEVGLAPHEQFAILDLAMRALNALHWVPQPPPGEVPPQPLRSKNVAKN